MGDGELFCIIKKTADTDESFYDNVKDIDINGVTYIWGEPTRRALSEGAVGIRHISGDAEGPYCDLRDSMRGIVKRFLKPPLPIDNAKAFYI